MKSLCKRILLLIPASVCITLFQNCSKTGPESFSASSLNNSMISESSTATGIPGTTNQNSGGEGYDGKINFINLAKESPCSDGSPIRSMIEVIGNVGRVVRDNCAVIANPATISSAALGLMPHNESNAMLNNHVFDLFNLQTDPSSVGAVSSRFLCRGTYENKNKSQTQVADVIVRVKNATQEIHSAIVMMGAYDKSGKMVDNLNSGEMELREIETGVEGRLKFVTPIVGKHSITLWIDKVGETKRTGKLSFIDLPYVGRDKEENYNYRDYERVIQNLDCFAQ